MEDMDQSYGYVLYRTRLEGGAGGELNIEGLHDYAQVYLDQKLIGTLDRRLAASQLKLPEMAGPATLDILVENSGRVNFTSVIRGERKGITGKVTLAGKEPKHWQIFSLPMDNVAQMHYVLEPCEGPCFKRTTFAASIADTYVDTTTLHKGMMWINQRPLGRFWSIGPQHTLFVPAPWLHRGLNEIVFFDLLSEPSQPPKTTDKPIFDRAIAHRE